MARSRAVLVAHAAAAGLEEPPSRGKLGDYATTEVLAKIPALRAVSDGDAERLSALCEMENAARELLERVEDSAPTYPQPPRRAKVSPTPRPPTVSEVIEIRAAYQRAAAGVRLPRVDAPHGWGH